MISNIKKLVHSHSLKLISTLVFWHIANLSLNAQERWSVDRATEWYAEQPWLVGCNFLPSSAINQLEMWQAESFDPTTIDRELEWAASIGMNTVRVFLHDLPWSEDRNGFFRRIDDFLAIAEKNKIRVMFVLFDGVWDPDPQSGLQNRPRTGVHNSGWVQSPGRVILADAKRQDRLKPYVTDLIAHFGKDDRIIVWDLFNEPDNPNTNSYGPLELTNKDEAAVELANKVFKWAREVAPSQPLTVGLWRGPAWDEIEALNRVHSAALEQSDIISFHNYDGPEVIQERVGQLRKYKRPLLCTEFMARGNGSTFAAILPVLKRERIAAYCWGLVDGKSQTKYPWSTWQTPTLGEPTPWHHDIFHANGRPYDADETRLILKLTTN